MPRVVTVFTVSVYGLSAIAGLMLAFAEGSPFPQIVTPALAIVAYVLTERTRLVHLPVIWANILGVAAFLYAGYGMFSTTIEERLLAGAHLLVYLTWIVLFQEKRLPQYWWMCALSVLQAAIGSILTISSSYGGMLVGFMFAAIWTLSLLSLYQAHLQYGQTGEGEEKGAVAGRMGGLTRVGRRRPGNLARSLLMQRSTSRGSMQLDPDERWLGVRFALSMLGVSGAALVVAAGFFLFIPRLWAGRTEWGAGETKQFRAAAMTGFTTEVHLGDLVPLLENPKRILQVSLFDMKGAPLDLERYCARIGYAEPLFRGATLESYEGGNWSGKEHDPTLPPVSATPEGACVRQQILQEPMGTPLLFAVQPVQAIRLPNPTEAAEVHLYSSQFFRPDSVPADKALSYSVYSPAKWNVRDGFRTVYDQSERSDKEYLDECASLPATRESSNEAKDADSSSTRRASRKNPTLVYAQPQLVELARKLTGFDPQTPLPAGTKEQDRSLNCVQILTRYLRDSGTYRYSLDTSLRDPRIDPVEDFVVNRKAGHCEYFASALALMLRAVAVPSRLASGFKGGSVNTISGVYEVEQRHAHVWVEAFIGAEGRGAWITVDPTPVAREASVQSFASRMGTAHELASVISSSWTRLVTGMDIETQQTTFYGPLLSAIRGWWNPARGSRPLLAQVVAGIVDFATDPTQWFTATGLTVATLFGVAVAGVIFLIRARSRLWQRLRGLWSREKRERRIRIAFYERFENLCRQLGLVRPRFQTQREFASTVGPRIREVVASADGLPEIPRRLVEFFYRARFGDEDLPLPVLEELNRDLAALELALRRSNRR